MTGGQESYKQYEVPDSTEFEELPIFGEPDDIIIFDRNILHQSEVNQSKDIGYLFVNRYFDISKDLTISANLGIRPYNSEANKLGRKINTN